MEKETSHKRQFLGKRVLKTALATTLALLISQLIFGQIYGFAGYSAIVAMTTNVPDSVNVSLKRIFATFIAAIFAIVLYLFDLVNFFTIFLVIVLIIEIGNLLKFHNLIQLSLIFFVAIVNFKGPKEEMIEYTFVRLVDTSIGLIVGVVVNLFIARPRTENFLYREYLNLYNLILVEFKGMIQHQEVHVDKLVQSISEIYRLYDTFKAERKYKISSPNLNFNLGLLNSKIARIAVNIIDLSYYENIPLDSENKKRLHNEYNIEEFNEIYAACSDKEISVYNYEVKRVLGSIDDISKDLVNVKKELIGYQGIIEDSIEKIEEEENVKISEEEENHSNNKK